MLRPEPLQAEPAEGVGVVAIDFSRVGFRKAEIGEGAVQHLDPAAQGGRLQADRIIAGVDDAVDSEGLDRGGDIGAQVGFGLGLPVRFDWQARELDPEVGMARQFGDLFVGGLDR